MKSFIGERGSGKTTALVKESHKTGKYILVANRAQLDIVYETAKRLELSMPFPITLYELTNGKVSNRLRRQGILIDEAPALLERVLDAKIHMYTATKEEVPND